MSFVMQKWPCCSAFAPNYVTEEHLRGHRIKMQNALHISSLIIELE